MLRSEDGFVPRKDFISAMRRVASSVTVVTTDGAMGRQGATVSAFASVSADPPTVLVCLFARSRTAEAVQGNGRFCVNVLRENCTAIADRFAGRHDTALQDRFEGLDCFGAPGQAPMIAAATAFRCDVQQTVLSGSHLIVIGHVRDVWDGDDRPLAWREGSYHRVVPHQIAVPETPN